MIAGMASAGAMMSSAADEVRVGKAFPAIKGTDALVNEEVSLEKLRGKVVIIDFWATWCGPCVAEIPRLRDTFAKFHEQGLEVVSISQDRSAAVVRDFAPRNKMTWRHIFDDGQSLARRFNVEYIPQTYVIDRNGVLVAANVFGEELNSVVRKALAAPAAAASENDARAPARPAVPEPEEWLKLARAMRAINDLEMSRGYYTRVIDKYPNSPEAKLAREELDALPAMKKSG